MPPKARFSDKIRLMARVYGVQKELPVENPQLSRHKSVKIVRSKPFNLFSYLIKETEKFPGTQPEKRVQSICRQIKKLTDCESPQQVYDKIETQQTIQQFQDVFRELVGRKKGEKIATHFFDMMGRKIRTLPPIQLFYQQLRKYSVPPDKILVIKHFVKRGWRYNVQMELLAQLGHNIGKKIFEKYKQQFPEIIRKPYHNAPFRGEKNGLNLYEYPQAAISQLEKSLAKTLIVFGETGSGKSTFLNALVNFLENIQVNDNFRYQIICDNDADQMHSVTKQITTYYVRDVNTGNLYRLVDTPGFGDTEGIEKDNQLVKKVDVLFKKEISVIHGILFIMKSSNVRLTSYHSYTFQSVMDLFGKNVAKNFIFVFTFSDSGKPMVLESVKDHEKGFGKYWDSLSEPKYLQVNNCGIFQKTDVGDQIKTGYWKIGMECIRNLFRKIQIIEGVSLLLTRAMMKTKQQLSLMIKNAKELLDNSLAKQSNITSHIEKIAQCSDEIDKLENFSYTVDQIEFYDQKTDNNVTRCSNCSNTNCHENCAYGNNDSKQKCSAMDAKGYCTVCPKKCSYIIHWNSHDLRRERTIKAEYNNNQMIMKYKINVNEKEKSEKILIEMFKELTDCVYLTGKKAEELIQLLEALNRISLTDKKKESTVEYLKFLIENQKNQREIGYEKRIESFNEVIREFQIVDNLTKGGAMKDLFGKLQDVRGKRNWEIIQKCVPKDMLDKFKQFIPPQKDQQSSDELPSCSMILHCIGFL